MNEKIGKVLKEYRKKNALSIAEVAFALNHRYQMSVAEKTIYGWESNQAHPTSDMLVVLCDLYGIHDVVTAFGSGVNHEFPVSAEERILVECYRKNPGLQEAVRRVLGMTREMKRQNLLLSKKSSIVEENI